MSIFQKVQKDIAKMRKPQTTVIQVEGYTLNKDIPGKSFITGKDLLNKDEAGNPKVVKVIVNDPDGKVMGVNKFANKSSLVHTEPGGLIRLDRFIARGNEYTCRHMQRIAQDSSMIRTDEGGTDYKIGMDEAWVKVRPDTDRNGDITTFNVRNNGLIHRGRAFLVPKANQPAMIKGGEAPLLDQIKAVAEKAIDQAPEKTLPMIMLRDPSSAAVIEVIIPNTIEREEGKRDLRTKEEMLAILPELDNVQVLLNNENELKGMTLEALPGYQMKVFGSIKDQQTGEEIEGHVRKLSRETTRMFAKPVEGKDRPEMVPGNQEYALGIVSYEIPQREQSTTANLITLGRIPGQVASPNAGRDTTPNPFYNNQEAPATQTTQSTASEPAQSASTSAPASAASEPAQAAPEQTSAAAPAKAQGGPEEPPMPTDAELELLLEQADDIDVDFDMDEVERQLSMGQG